VGVPALLAALSTLLVPCGVPGEWPHTRDAAWTVKVLRNGLRAVWRAGRRNVWIEAGPTTRRLLHVARWRALVAASVVTPG